jgi:predicted site-specific integrase-resolvase
MANKRNFLRSLYRTNRDAFVQLSTEDAEIHKILNIKKKDFSKIKTTCRSRRRVYIKYARVSSKAQRRNGSLKKQQKYMTHFLTNKLNIKKEDQYAISECASSWHNIPAILRQITHKFRNITICFTRYDRFSRDVDLFVAELWPAFKQNNIKLQFCNSGHDMAQYSTSGKGSRAARRILIEKIKICQETSNSISRKLKRWHRRR